MLVTERVPVSEIEDVEMTVVDAGGFRYDAKDGFLPARGGARGGRDGDAGARVRDPGGGAGGAAG